MGEPPLEAALKGAKQIGFTVISLSVSLIAVFIPLLFMTGIVGRLFREFAITLSVAVARVGHRLADADADDVRPLAASRRRRKSTAASIKLTERMFKGMLDCLRARPAMGAPASGADAWRGRSRRWSATIWLYIIVPKGLLPQQDTGLIIGVTDAAQSISFKAMVERQRVIAEIVRKDPDVVSVASFVGAGTVNATVNTGRLYISLKPRDQRAAGAGEIIDRLREATKDVEGISLFMQAVQDVQIDSRVSRTQYQYTLQDADEAELSQWAPQLLAKLRTLPELADVASDQQSDGLQLNIEVDRDKASRLNVLPQAIDDTLYDAFGQRQVSIIFTQLNQYRVILEAEPQFQLTPEVAGQDLCQVHHRPDGAAERLRHLEDRDGAAGDHPPGPVSGGDAFLQSAVPAARWARRSRPSTRPKRKSGCRRRS